MRQEFGLASKEPAWLELPAMMRMALTSPNVMRTHRPQWLAPFNFFFFPLVSELGGYPAGHDHTNFRFIAPFTSDREKWSTLKGINVIDEQPYAIEIVPSVKQDKVVPESCRIILRLYLRHPESKSLAPNGSACVAENTGLLGRASIVAGEMIPVGKETDRRWEQGEDMSLLDFKVLQYRPSPRMVVADAALRERIIELGMRESIHRTGLSQHTLEAVLKGKVVRQTTRERAKVAITK